MTKGPISQFIDHHYRHFNAASLIDAAKAYEDQLDLGNKMMITLYLVLMFKVSLNLVKTLT